MDTGGAMPPAGHIPHASSEDLRRLVIQCVQELAKRNGISEASLLGEFLADFDDES